jgi:hypothetical protein
MTASLNKQGHLFETGNSFNTRVFLLSQQLLNLPGNFFDFVSPNFYFSAHKTPLLIPFLSHMNPPNAQLSVSLGSILIISHVRQSLPCVLFASDFSDRSLPCMHFAGMMRATCPVHHRFRGFHGLCWSYGLHLGF